MAVGGMDAHAVVLRDFEAFYRQTRGNGCIPAISDMWICRQYANENNLFSATFARWRYHVVVWFIYSSPYSTYCYREQQEA